MLQKIQILKFFIFIMILVFSVSEVSYGQSMFCRGPKRQNLASKFSMTEKDRLLEKLSAEAAAQDDILKKLEVFGIDIDPENIGSSRPDKHHLDTVSLKVEGIHDPKRLWVMDDYNPLDLVSKIKNLEELISNQVQLTGKLNVKLQSTAYRVKHKEGGHEHGDVYLSFISNVPHPVAIKVLKPRGRSREAIYIAQFLSILGFGPKFYGMGMTAEGKYFYAMQAVEGYFVDSTQETHVARSHNQKFQNGIYSHQFLRTSKGIDIPIDFENMSLMNFRPGKQSVFEKLSILLRDIQEEKRGGILADGEGIYISA